MFSMLTESFTFFIAWIKECTLSLPGSYFWNKQQSKEMQAAKEKWHSMEEASLSIYSC